MVTGQSSCCYTLSTSNSLILPISWSRKNTQSLDYILETRPALSIYELWIAKTRRELMMGQQPYFFKYCLKYSWSKYNMHSLSEITQTKRAGWTYRATCEPKWDQVPKCKPEKRLPWCLTTFNRYLKSPIGKILLWSGAELCRPPPYPKYVPRDLKNNFKKFLIWYCVEPILCDFFVYLVKIRVCLVIQAFWWH